MRLLDLFCKAGGAAKGYADAGWEVVGVDIEPQPNYPFTFVHGDALVALAAEGLKTELGWRGSLPNDFDAVHASPPCQAFTAYQRTGNVRDDHPDLVAATRDLLDATGLPYVIENVEGAPLLDPVKLCGSMFDPPMDVRRHRLFETNWPLEPPAWPCRHKLQGPNRFPGGRSKERGGDNKTPVRNTIEIGSWDLPLERQAEAMEVDWPMTLDELSNAIPPRYTEFIGRQLMAHVRGERAAA